jgi:plastocyanin
MPATNEEKLVKIAVDTKTRDVTVAPTAVNVTPGMTLRWEAENAQSFVLTFDDARLLDKGHEIVGNGGKAEARILERKGIFHYDVALSVNGEVFVLTGCPSVHTH